MPPKRLIRSHKGDNGRILIVGGSQRYIGAVTLAGLAAMRSGADLVTIAAPHKVAWAVNCLSPDLITIKLTGKYLSEKDIPQITHAMKVSDVLLIGNGLGRKLETIKTVNKLLRMFKGKKVVDADALSMIQKSEIYDSILTPHSKEYEVLLKNNSKKLLLERRNVILKKGQIDSIIKSDKVVYNKTGNAGMTKGGTGDVLAGLASGYLAQTKDLFRSAYLASYWNGKIGDHLLKKHRGYTYIASDMINEIKRITKKYE